MRALVTVFFLITLISVSGCESSAKKDAMLIKMDSISDKVGFLYKNAKVQADMAANLNQLQDSIAALTGQIAELNERTQMLSGRIENVERSASTRRVGEDVKSANIRLEKISESLESLSAHIHAFIHLMEKKSGISRSRHRKAVIAVLNSGESGEMIPPDEPGNINKFNKETKGRESRTPEGLYQQSYGFFLQGEYDKAISGFRGYLSRYPDTDLSDNAAYWIGEALYGKADYSGASKSFDDMAESFSASNKAPSALLESAKSLLQLDEKEEAVKRYNLIIERYPTSSEAIIATEWLEAAKAGKTLEKAQ
ncbi:MAG TPA: tol-pal system protein YbgF [Nitrospirae bacterium]|nr:tol-pal system protein YbgF [Nitrospirota bacterium]